MIRCFECFKSICEHAKRGRGGGVLKKGSRVGLLPQTEKRYFFSFGKQSGKWAAGEP